MTVLVISCTLEKKYEDYPEDNFYEVQGIINYAVPDGNPFNSFSVKNISFSYYLDRKTPKKGFEHIDMFEAQKGFPVIILVHKKLEDVSYYGRVGILEDLNNKEKGYLKNHFEQEMGKIQ